MTHPHVTELTEKMLAAGWDRSEFSITRKRNKRYTEMAFRILRNELDKRAETIINTLKQGGISIRIEIMQSGNWYFISPTQDEQGRGQLIIVDGAEYNVITWDIDAAQKEVAKTEYKTYYRAYRQDKGFEIRNPAGYQKMAYDSLNNRHKKLTGWVNNANLRKWARAKSNQMGM